MNETTERLERDRKRNEVHRAGIRAGMKLGEEARNSEVFGELDSRGVVE